MPTDDGYPTPEELKAIKTWSSEDIIKKPGELVEFLKSIWWQSGWGFSYKKGRNNLFHKTVWKLELHTGGWSGNEDIIDTLRHTYFWFFYWQKSIRGGHYWFEIPIRKDKKGAK